MLKVSLCFTEVPSFFPSWQMFKISVAFEISHPLMNSYFYFIITVESVTSQFSLQSFHTICWMFQKLDVK